MLIQRGSAVGCCGNQVSYAERLFSALPSLRNQFRLGGIVPGHATRSVFFCVPVASAGGFKLRRGNPRDEVLNMEDM